jgi:hypothetical protein
LQISGGALFASVKYDVRQDETTGNAHSSDGVECERGSGPGWHAQVGLLSGHEKVEFRIALGLSRSQLTSTYTRYSWSASPGGSSSSRWNGEFDDRFTYIEMPVQISIAAARNLRFDLGCATWILVSADHRDQGTKTAIWSIYTQGSGTSLSTYDETSRAIKPYSQYGLSGIVSVSYSLKQRMVASLSASIGITPTYRKGDPYTGHQTVFRVSVGYVLTAWGKR